MAESGLASWSLVPNERYQLVDSPTIISERVDSLPLLLAHLERMDIARLIDTHIAPDDDADLSLGWVMTIWLATLISHPEHRQDSLPAWVSQRRETLRRCVGQTVHPHEFDDLRLSGALQALTNSQRWEQFEAALNQRLRAFGLEPGQVQLLEAALRETQAARAQLLSRIDTAQRELEALNNRRRGKFTQLDDLRHAAEEIVATHRLEEVLRIECHESVSTRPVRRYRGRPEVVRTEHDIRVSAEVNAAALTSVIWRLGWWSYATTMPPQHLALMRTLLAYRSAYLIDRGTSYLDPLFAETAGPATDATIAGLVRLLTIGVQVLALIDHLAQPGQSLALGGQGGTPRRRSPLTSERLLSQFDGLTLTIVRDGPRPRYHLTSLSAEQQELLRLLELPPEIYTRLSVERGVAARAAASVS